MVRMARDSGRGSSFARRGRSHASHIREPRAGEWYVSEDPPIATQTAPPTAAGHRSPWRSALRSPPRLSESGGSTSLNGLPDIGDPFDVAALRAFRIPDDQNAFVFLRRAHEKLTPIRWGEGPYPDDRKFSWSIANPKSREWAGENREALELFLRAGDQPDASLPAGEPTTRMDVGGLDYVVFLEGSRRQESGDTTGAWDCYRALLRMITHFRRRGNTRQRYSAQRVSPGLQRRLTDWATDPRTTTPQLHTAMDEVLKNEPNPDWDISAIKYGYLDTHARDRAANAALRSAGDRGGMDV